MKLYYTKGACSLAPRIIINEIGLPCEYESVDLKSKKTETGKDYYSINPKGAVPTLMTDEGEILTENAIIQQYLAEKSHAMELLPPVGDFTRYRVLEWLNYITTELHKGLGLLFNPMFPQATKDEIIKPLIQHKIHYVNKQLSQQYLLGEIFTLPDSYLFVMITWMFYFKFNLTDSSNLLRYFSRLKERPSIQKSLEQEEIVLA